jgi:hypothetical protein
MVYFEIFSNTDEYVLYESQRADPGAPSTPEDQPENQKKYDRSEQVSIPNLPTGGKSLLQGTYEATGYPVVRIITAQSRKYEGNIFPLDHPYP